MSKNYKLLVEHDNNMNEKIERATQTLDRTIGFINTCDNKTSIVLTAVGVLFTIILTNDDCNTILEIMQKCFEKKTICDISLVLFFGLSLIGYVFLKSNSAVSSTICFTLIIDLTLMFVRTPKKKDFRNESESFNLTKGEVL